MRRIYYIICLVLYSTTLAFSQDCRERDSLALVALYNSSNGNNWINPWVLEESIDTWNGVSLNGIGCVRRLNLNERMLNGNIPPELFDQEYLESLDLADNNLTGEIPKDIGKLKNLERLILDNNNLNSNIPQNLWDLESLESIVLSDNNLTGEIPKKIANLTNLNTLWLDNNNLNGDIPLEIWNLESLESIALSDNNLTGEIPKEIANLNNLNALVLARNKLNGNIPPEIFCLENLEQILLSDNKLTGEIPKEISNLNLLRNLHIDNNNLIGNIPPEIWSLENLESILLSHNELTGEISIETANLNKLIVLQLDNNRLTGLLPSKLSNLNNLEYLDLSNNDFSGCIPISYKTFCGTTDVNLASNVILFMEGDFATFCSIESQIGTVCDDGNPETISDQINEDCECAGHIRVVNECRERDSLALVDLFNSTNGRGWATRWNLNNPINEWEGIKVSESGCVEEILLSVNDMVGSLPPSLGNISELLVLRLSYNNLKGEIPVEFGQLLRLEELSLSNNEFESGFPIQLLQLSALKELRLGSNKFSGEIPKDINKLVNLEVFDLNNNTFSGNIPDQISELGSLIFLYLSSNQLEGPIPKELGNMNSIEIVWLCSNLLDGELPPELSNLLTLKNLRIRDNNLTGEIPSEYSKLVNLESFLLSDNNLSGCFPEAFNDLCFLTTELVSICAEIDRCQYNFENNPLLPWQGDFKRFCEGDEQMGASCDDGNPETRNDIINENCECLGEVESSKGALTIDAVNSPTCIGEKTGSILITLPEGFIPPVSCDWRNENNEIVSTSNENCNLLNAFAGTYLLIAVDMEGDSIAETVVIPSSELSIDFDIVFNDCENNPILFDATNSILPDSNFNVTWSFGGNQNINGNLEQDPNILNQTFQFTTPGQKEIVLTIFSEDCSYSEAKSIDYYPLPEFAFGLPTVSCSKSDNIMPTIVGLDNTNYELLWDFGDGNTSEELEPSHVYDIGGLYDVSLTLTTPNECQQTLSNQIEIIDSPIASFESVDTSNNINSTITFENTSINATIFEWDFGDGSLSDEINPTNSYSEIGDYVVELIAFDEFGICSDTIQADIEIISNQNIVFTNAITPDRFGTNDVLRFSEDEVIEDSELWIYNRWGDQIYHKKNYTNDWNGGGYPEGVYFYVLKVGDTVIKKTLTILR